MDPNKQHEQFAEAAEYYANRRGSRPTLEQEDTIALLRETQEIYGHIPPHALETISICTGYKVPLLEKLIRLYPSLKLGAAAHEIVVCSGGRCGARNAVLLDRLKKGLAALPEGTAVLRTQNCFKQCGKGPNIQVDGVLRNGCDAAAVDRILAELAPKKR